MMRRPFRHAAMGLAAIGLGGVASPALAQTSAPTTASALPTADCPACEAARAGTPTAPHAHGAPAAEKKGQSKFRLFGGQRVRSDSEVRPTNNATGTATVGTATIGGGAPSGLTPIAPPAFSPAEMSAPGMGMAPGAVPAGSFSPEPTPIGMMSNVNTIGPNGAATAPGRPASAAMPGMGYGPQQAPGFGPGPQQGPGYGPMAGPGAPGMGMPPQMMGMAPGMVPPAQTFIPKGSSRAKTWLSQMFRIPRWRSVQADKLHQMELEQRRYEVMRENAMRGMQPAPAAAGYGQ
jgi:hypothetical protein